MDKTATDIINSTSKAVPADRLTSLTLNWHYRGMASAESPVHEVIKVSRNPSAIQWSQYNGLKDRIQQRSYRLSSQEQKTIFQLFQDIFGPYDGFDSRNLSDYYVDVCDGSEWEIVLRYSHNPVKHITGTVELPPYGNQITIELKKLLAAHGCDVSPAFFGFE